MFLHCSNPVPPMSIAILALCFLLELLQNQKVHTLPEPLPERIHQKLLVLFQLEWISSEVLLYSTGNSIESLGIEHDGGQCEIKSVCVYIYIYIYDWVTCCTAEIDTTL